MKRKRGFIINTKIIALFFLILVVMPLVVASSPRDEFSKFFQRFKVSGDVLNRITG